MPSTRARTSAVRMGSIRPGRSTFRSTGWLPTVITKTFTGARGTAAASFRSPHPANTIVQALNAYNTTRRTLLLACIIPYSQAVGLKVPLPSPPTGGKGPARTAQWRGGCAGSAYFLWITGATPRKGKTAPEKGGGPDRETSDPGRTCPTGQGRYVPGVRRPHRDTNKTIDFRTRILYVRDKGNWLTKCCVVILRTLRCDPLAGAGTLRAGARRFGTA